MAHGGEELRFRAIGLLRVTPCALEFRRQPQPRILAVLGSRDIAGRGEDQSGLRLRLGLPRQPLVGAVLAAVAVLERQRRHSISQPLEFGPGPDAVVRMHEVEERPRQQLLLAPAERRRERRIQPLEVAIGPGDAQHVERQIEELLPLHLRGPARADVLHHHQCRRLAPVHVGHGRRFAFDGAAVEPQPFRLGRRDGGALFHQTPGAIANEFAAVRMDEVEHGLAHDVRQVARAQYLERTRVREHEVPAGGHEHADGRKLHEPAVLAFAVRKGAYRRTFA